MEEMEGEKRSLEARRERLELPAIDKEMLRSIVDNFEKVMAEGPNPKKKHLLHQLVKKVLIHDRRTIEVWYCLPNRASVRRADYLAPRVGHTTNVSSATHPGHPEITQDESGHYEPESGRMSHSTNRSRPQGPEIWYRIVHAAVVRKTGAPSAIYREQEVEVALGPMGIFEDDRFGILTRRIDADQVVSVVPLTRGDLKSPTYPRTPRVTELLRRAIEWRRQIDAREVRNQADIARREGITRARVTQVIGMLRLGPEIQNYLLSIPDTVQRPAITERALRSIEAIADHAGQLRELQNRSR